MSSPRIALTALLLGLAVVSNITAMASAHSSLNPNTTINSPSRDFISIDPTTLMFLDPQGRTRLFHGVNIVYKLAPYYPPSDKFDPVSSLSDKDIDDLVKWGFTFVRLGVLWVGVEPTRGNINSTYLQAIDDIVNRLYEKGIFTLLDSHQDVLSPKFCGEGAPDWAVHPKRGNNTFPAPLPFNLTVDPNTGYPEISDCLMHSFADYYLTSECGSSFQAIYDNVDSLADEFANAWRSTAQFFASNPGVIGYELWNEPWVGDLERNPLLIEPGYADLHHLTPLYEKLNTAIRTVDTEHLVFYEAVQTDAFFPEGFEEAPGGANNSLLTVSSYHVYCGDINSTLFCELFDQSKVLQCAKDAKRLGGGAFLTEFGAVPSSSAGLADINRVTAFAEKELHSWSYWQFKYFSDITTSSSSESLYFANGTLDEAKVKALTRTYATAIQGVPALSHFDSLNGEYTLEYKLRSQVTGPTEIFFSLEYFYPNGVKVVIKPLDSASYSISTDKNRVYVTANPDTPDGTDISVVLSPL